MQGKRHKDLIRNRSIIKTMEGITQDREDAIKKLADKHGLTIQRIRQIIKK